jgi:hypothetical protein
LNEFLIMADIIAQAAVEVPPPIVDVAKRAVAARMHCTEWFQGHAESAQSNKGHTGLQFHASVLGYNYSVYYLQSWVVPASRVYLPIGAFSDLTKP